MADSYKNDGLEDFFRRRMKDYEEAPPSEMWNNIGAAIPPKPENSWWKKPIWWLAGLLALVLFFSLWQYQRLSQFEKIIDKQRVDIESLKNNQETTGINRTDEVTLETPQPSLSIDSDQIIQQPGESAEGKIPSDNYQSIANFTNTVKEAPPSLTTLDNLLNKSISAQTLETPSGNDLKTESPIAPIPVSSITNITRAPAKYIMTAAPGTIEITFPDLGKSIAVNQSKSKAGFYFSLSGGTQYTTYNASFNRSLKEVSSDDGEGYHLSNTVRDEFTFLAGIQFNENWSIETGVGYRNNRVGLFDSRKFNYSNDLNFDYDTEGNPIGSYTNTGNQTPVFRYEIVNSLMADGQDVEDGHEFYIDAFFKYNTRYLNLPFWLKYRAGNKKIHVYGKTGLAWNILTVSNKNLGSSNISNDRLSLDEVEFKHDALNDSFLELGFALGMEYDLNKHTSLGLESVYYHSVASVLSTKQDAIGLSAAIKYNF
jgi:hypothetical protein